jgi:hypothetical protein
MLKFFSLVDLIKKKEKKNLKHPRTLQIPVEAMPHIIDRHA